MIHIGLVQAAACRDISANLDTMRRFVREASRKSCQAICFPECFLTGYIPEEADHLAISADSPILQQISEAAAEYSIDILAGFMERDGAAFFITHGLFRRDGTRDCYRKTHLGSREKLHFTPGSSLDVFPLSCGIPIGIQLCVETHYPDITQTLSLRGAQLIFAPHAVPRVSGDRWEIWSKYIPARSYDNRVFMACCNLWDTRFGGGCLVTGPRGEVCGSCFEDREALLVCPIDETLTASYRDSEVRRSAHFFPVQRRTELYE